jgi:hypothetical protein
MFPMIHGILSGAGRPPLLLDTFTGTNGTNITVHTPDINPGGAYSVVAGACEIQSGRAQTTASATTVSKNIGVDGGYSLAVEFWTANTLSSHSGVLLRVNNATNYVIVGHDNTGTNFIIGYRTGGGLTTVSSAAVSFATTTMYTIAPTIDGSSGIIATLNGGNQISGTAAVLTGNNTTGFRNYNGGLYDNLEVT